MATKMPNGPHPVVAMLTATVAAGEWAHVVDQPRRCPRRDRWSRRMERQATRAW
jgi:hypothetical protein